MNSPDHKFSENGFHEQVKDYYGKVLQSSNDLKTTACCSTDVPEPHLRDILLKIHPEVTQKFYGCGTPLPDALEGTTVLDLGSGTGRDCYILSNLVGASGSVIGIDMTDNQLAVAKAHEKYHADKFGYARSNTSFRKGFIEDLAEAGIEDNSVDLVVSNCVINLSPFKDRVFSEIFRVLKPGGELYFSDVFSTRRIPPALKEDPVLYGECLSGAMYIEDFRRLLLELGCPDYRIVSSSKIDILNPRIKTSVGYINFCSMTVRAFKLDSLEDRCEDYGQVAYYRGTIPHRPHGFQLDEQHLFEAGSPVLVCGNTAAMLAETRLAPHFRIEGDRSQHRGLFDRTPKDTGTGSIDQTGEGTGCC